MNKIKKRILLFHLILILALYFTILWFFGYYNLQCHLLTDGMQKNILLGFFLAALSGSLILIKTGRK